MSASSESVVGIVPANARLGIGFEELLLVVTNQRIIVAHRGKKGRGGLASTIILGGHSGDFVDPDKPKTKFEEIKGHEDLDPEKIMASHKNNFGISFPELISVQVEDGRESTKITMVTGDEKFQFFTRELARDIFSMLSEHLGDKLLLRKLPVR